MEIQGWGWGLAILGGLGFFILFSSLYGFWVYTRPGRILSTLTPQDLGISYEDATITTADNLKLAAWFVPAQIKTKGAILLLHGYPADKGDILPSTFFLQRNFNLLYLDFRYFGKSQGRYSTIGIKEIQDVVAAVDYLKNLGMEKVGVYGFSMGGATALMSLTFTPQINAVVADSSYASLAVMAEEVYKPLPGLNKIIGRLMVAAAKKFLKIDVRRQSPLVALAASKNPVLLIHSTTDEVIPFRNAQLLKKEAQNNPYAEFWFRDSVDHGELGTPEYNEKVQKFFQKYL